LQKKIEDTEARFAAYGKTGLLCGKDGLPHLITDGRWTHAGEVTYPALGFLYVAGWIGWVGRSYLQYGSTQKKPTETEIIIDVPVASKMALNGFMWPIAAWREFTSGRLLVAEEEITVSPR
jgi:photosystem I subunit 3